MPKLLLRHRPFGSYSDCQKIHFYKHSDYKDAGYTLAIQATEYTLKLRRLRQSSRTLYLYVDV
ncbi:hypothetical protein EJB05_47693, partial [Eragrostis curvula]